MRFKIISYNLKSLEWSNLNKLSTFLLQHKYDIICLQETESSMQGVDLEKDVLKLTNILNKMSGRKYTCHFSKTVARFRKKANYGITILSLYPIVQFQEFYYQHKKYEKRCCQMIKIFVGKTSFKIYHTHFGWQTNQEIQVLQLQEFWKFRDDKCYSILCGDLNMNAYNSKNKDITKILTKSFEILEDFKKKYQDTKMELYTYPTKNPKYRYDYILLSRNILDKLQAKYYYQVIKNFESDHLPIVCSIYLPNL